MFVGYDRAADVSIDTHRVRRVNVARTEELDPLGTRPAVFQS